MATRTVDEIRPGRTTNAALALIGFLLLSHAAGAISAFTTDSSLYSELRRPDWAPPGWLFGPVWLTLYTLMGVAAWLVWRTAPGESRTHALTWFGIQLVLNAAWTPIFFGLGEVGAGLVVLAAIVVAVLGTVIQFGKRSQLAAWLMVPYLAWVSFALCLNAALWWLNR